MSDKYHELIAEWCNKRQANNPIDPTEKQQGRFEAYDECINELAELIRE